MYCLLCCIGEYLPLRNRMNDSIHFLQQLLSYSNLNAAGFYFAGTKQEEQKLPSTTRWTGQCDRTPLLRKHPRMYLIPVNVFTNRMVSLLVRRYSTRIHTPANGKHSYLTVAASFVKTKKQTSAKGNLGYC